MGMMASNVGGAYAESISNQTSSNSNSAQSLTENTTTGVSNTTVEGNTTNTESTSDESNDSSLNESSNKSTTTTSTNSKSESENSTTSSDNSTNTSDNTSTTSDNSTSGNVTAVDDSTNSTTNGTVSGNSTSSVVSYTLSEIEDAASRVAAFIEKNSRLPNYVTISGTQVSMQDFLYLAVSSVLNINSGSTSSVNSSVYTSPASSVVSDYKNVKVYASEYLKIAESIASFMESNGRAPNYASSSKGKISYASLIYMYAKILNFESTNNRLPNYATTTSIKYTVNNITTTIPTTTISDNSTTSSDNTTTNSTTSDNSTNTTTGNSTVATDNSTNTTTNGTVTDNSTNSTLSFTLSEIEEAATGLVTYVKANSSLPDYVTINGTQVSMSNFLNLLVNSVLNIYNNSTSTVTLGNYSSAPNSAENVTAGKINESEYITMAESIASFMESNGRAPNYASSSLGNMGYESLIYMYSKILAFAETNSRLPNYNTVATWETVTNNTTTTSDNSTTSTDTSDDIPSEYEKYLAATTNCQSTNSKIIALANSIISDAGATTTYAKAVAIYNWVRDNITYSFYSGTKYGAVGTLNAGKGNCCDKTNLLIALLRAAGIPARYVHGYCYFTTSGHWYGHIWAEVYVNGTWYTADTTSSRNSFGTVKNWNTATATIYGRYATIPC